MALSADGGYATPRFAGNSEEIWKKHMRSLNFVPRLEPPSSPVSSMAPSS